MASQPPHPDEDDLARFHNGDTLDNIPVVRLPAQATSSKRRRHLLHAPVALVPVMAIVGTLAGIGVAALMDGPTEPPAAAAGAPHRTTAAVTAPTATASTQSASATPWVEPSAPSAPMNATGLERILVTAAPPTGGDPSTTYCLTYPDAAGGERREARLLSNVLPSQCMDILVDSRAQVTNVWAPNPITCEGSARPAEVTFTPETERGGGEELFTCLVRRIGT